MRVLIIGPIQLPSCEIGIIQPLRYLKEKGLCYFSAKQEDQTTADDVAAADIIVFCRTIRPQAYSFLELAHQLGKRTVYVIDDHLLAIPLTTDVGRHYNNLELRKTFTKFIKNAQIVKVASKYFANHLRIHFNPREIVCFTGSVDFSIMDKLEDERKERTKWWNRHKGKPLVIGYEGGRKDGSFNPVVPAIQKIILKYGDRVRIEFMGYFPSELAGRKRVSHIPSIDDYREFLSRLYKRDWDIGLSPLEETLFHRCKTNNKFRDYAACEIAGIYSASPAYEEWVSPQETGLLVPQTEESWYTAIRCLIEDHDLRESIQQKAKHYARRKFTIEECAEKWHKLILNGSMNENRNGGRNLLG